MVRVPEAQRLLSGEAKLIYVYTILKKHHLPKVGPKQLCASAHLGCTREAGYFLVTPISYHTEAFVKTEFVYTVQGYS